MAERFKDRLKHLRTKKEINQEDLAKILNVHRTAVSNWEMGRRFPDEEMLNRIANYFNVSMNYLMGDNKGEQQKEDSPLLKAMKNSTIIAEPASGGYFTTQLLKRLLDENIINDKEDIDKETLDIIKDAIKLDAKMNKNLKKGSNK